MNIGVHKQLPLSQLLPIASVVDERGTLCFLQESSEGLPFTPQRTFWITGVPLHALRGGHAHTTCHEFIVAIQGAFSVVCYNGQKRLTYHLDTIEHGLWIPAGVWCELYDFSPDAICLVVASERYDVTGYINDRETFESYVSQAYKLSE
ncbi:MAG: FdtA/QdtA family cupin domain-containing protein [Bacteroidales bacterium]|nr:FdtA/QdtA family cupin domain-containing protein [Bacteroidales bacterium]